MRHLLKLLPKVDTLLSHQDLQNLPQATLKRVITSILHTLRDEILAQKIDENQLQIRLEQLIPTIKAQCKLAQEPTLKRIINATGVILQTNFGRSIFSQSLLDEITPFLQSYHTLEYDLHTGKRGERYIHTKETLCEMLGCEDALLVNNNASAVLLILNTFARNKEVIISRGELVEIGGSFRIPEVMKCASSILREVGSTNKTHLKDYQEAINEQSAMIMKTHQSNFKQIGFVQSCDMRTLTHLAQEHGLIDYYDLGSGHLGVLDLPNEPSVKEILKHKPSLISFSGDKLLGGPQAGIIIGKSALIKQLKQNQLLRALRVDKFTILALEATLKAYKEQQWHKIPTLAMLQIPQEALQQKAQSLYESLKNIPHIQCEMINLQSIAGGGSLPEETFASFGVSLYHTQIPTKTLESLLREKGLITSTKQNRILLDVRTLLEGDEKRIVEILSHIAHQENKGNNDRFS